MRRGLSAARRRNTVLFLLPSAVGVAVYYVLPFGVIVYFALQSGAVNGHFVGLQNFRRLLQNSAFLLGAKNTLLLLVPSVLLSVLLSLLLAILLERCIPMQSSLRTAFLSPMMVPVASVVLVWQILFQRNGIINAAFGANVDWFHSNGSRVMVLLLYFWKNLGYFTILLTSALASVPRELMQMAELDGAGAVRRFFAVQLPYLAASLVFVSVMSLISSMKIFREVYLLTGSYPAQQLYLLQHFMNNTFRSMDYPKLCSAALLLTTVMCAGISLLLRFERRIGRDVENE